jgi:hypothetical protein
MTSKAAGPTERPKRGSPLRTHRGALPHCLRKALALALASQSDYALLKYNGGDRPTFSDVLKMVGGSREIGKYLFKSLFNDKGKRLEKCQKRFDILRGKRLWFSKWRKGR